MSEGKWSWGIWHVAPDGTWWAPERGGRASTWREAFDAAFKAISKHPDEDAVASVRKVSA